MKQITLRAISSLLIIAHLGTPLLALVTDEEEEEVIYELTPFTVDTLSDVGYGATPGGAQDISFTRSEIASGKIPLPSSFTAEGLFSEHDLPLDNPQSCDSLICVYGEATPANILEQENVTHLAQIGFASGIDPVRWQREPLNLVAVVDKSGSMMGQPLDLVRKSLMEVLKHLGEDDQLSIVLYGDRSHVYMYPQSTHSSNKASIRETIRNIQSAGSTNLESGLRVGYNLAENSARSFKGKTRLMLFTDERPNTGNTSEHGFMTQMRRGSEKGIGLTTIGVSRHFGADLANTISSVRGGNLFYFPDSSSMKEKFANEFETMITELAYDMQLTFTPERGYRIAGVYGIPGDMLRWSNDKRSLYLEVETLFLSLRKGAIYFTLEQDRGFRRSSSDHVASVSLSYLQGSDNFPVSQHFAIQTVPVRQASLGLKRGEYLINEYIGLKKATALHHEMHRSKEAYEIVSKLDELFASSGDTALEPELELIGEIHNNLAIASGIKKPFLGRNRNSPLDGYWVADIENQRLENYINIIRFHSNRVIEVLESYEGSYTETEAFCIATKPFNNRRKGRINVAARYRAHGSGRQSPVITELLDRAEYLEDIESIKYQVVEDSLWLTLKPRYGTEQVALKFHRIDEGQVYLSLSPEIELDRLTGLPVR